jgi:hypothetical protein
VRPLIGPGFAAAGALGDAERPVLLTYETWQRRYGTSEAVLSLAWTANENRPVVGQGWELERTSWRVVGVLPPGFLLPSSDVVAGRYDGIFGFDPGFDPALDRSRSFQRVSMAPFARLQPGVSVAEAQTRISGLLASTLRPPASYQGSFRGLTVVERPESVSRSARLPAGS